MFFTIKVITIQSTDKASELLSISFGMADVNQSLAFSFPSKVEDNQREATLKRTFSNFKVDLLLQNLRHFWFYICGERRMIYVLRKWVMRSLIDRISGFSKMNGYSQLREQVYIRLSRKISSKTVVFLDRIASC
jgi:hypothetical protein